MCPTSDRCLLDEKIFEATIRVLANEGYDGATTRKIAEEAGINEVTLFRRFKNKDNLVKLASLWNVKRSIKNMDRMFDTVCGDDLRESMITLGKRMSAGIDDRTTLILISIGEMQRLPASERIQPSGPTYMLDRLAEYFKGQIEKGNMRAVNSYTAACDFVGYMFYVNFLRKVNGLPSIDNDERSFEAFIDIFINGVRAPEKKTA